MREYHYEINYVQGKYNYVADQLSRPVQVIQRQPTSTILGLSPEEFKTCQREEVLERNGGVPRRRLHSNQKVS